MILSKCSSVNLISSFDLNQIGTNGWKSISDSKFSYLICNNPSTVYLLYPGFVFSSDEAAQFYDENILSFIKNNLNAFTTPRGNLSKSNNIIFIGQRPGTFTAHLSKAESAWLLGPSSKMLIKACKDLNIYPYFTNFYHSHYINTDRNYKNILFEISKIYELYTRIYNIEKLNIVFLGNYSEYDELINNFKDRNNLNIIKIWHPAYLIRSYSEDKYLKWIKNLKGKLI